MFTSKAYFKHEIKCNFQMNSMDKKTELKGIEIPSNDEISCIHSQS